MHAPSPMALLLIAIVVLVLFGRGKVSSLMGEVGKGITAFKRGVRDGADEVERTVDTATDRAAIRADRSADDLEAAAAKARAEADRQTCRAKNADRAALHLASMLIIRRSARMCEAPRLLFLRELSAPSAPPEAGAASRVPPAPE